MKRINGVNPDKCKRYIEQLDNIDKLQPVKVKVSENVNERYWLDYIKPKKENK